MVEKRVLIKNIKGAHANSISLIVNLAHKYNSDVLLIVRGSVVNAKSIMSLFTFPFYYGEEIIIRTNGSDEEALANALEELINNRFYEEF